MALFARYVIVFILDHSLCSQKLASQRAWQAASSRYWFLGQRAGMVLYTVRHRMLLSNLNLMCLASATTVPILFSGGSSHC